MMKRQLTAEVIEWFANRGIGEETLQLLGIGGGMERFGKTPEPAAYFPYFLSGTEKNCKIRSLSQKSFRSTEGAKQIFYNLDRVLNGPKDTVWIVEGEADAAAMVEAGIPLDAVISVPSASSPTRGDEDPRGRDGYAYVLEALQMGLARVQRFILATDTDDVGKRLRSDLAAIMGPAKCWFLDWPEGCKDANEMLLSDGPDNLREYARAAPKPWPIDGLYRLSEMPDPPALELWPCGIAEWGKIVQFSPTMISVGTGFPGGGKTHLALQFLADISNQFGIGCAVMSAETRIKPYVRRYLRSIFLNRREVEMDQDMKDRADLWINDRFQFMAHPDAAPNFRWFMNTAEAAVIRGGARMILLDPWNKLESSYDSRRQSETQWIGECLDEIIQFARGLNVHVMILAHPAKPGDMHKGPPTPYMISGSAHWYNRPDQIWAIHRHKPKNEVAYPDDCSMFYHYKVRVDDLGKTGKMGLRLDHTRGRFVAYE